METQVGLSECRGFMLYVFTMVTQNIFATYENLLFEVIWTFLPSGQIQSMRIQIFGAKTL